MAIMEMEKVADVFAVTWAARKSPRPRSMGTWRVAPGWAPSEVIVMNVQKDCIRAQVPAPTGPRMDFWIRPATNCRPWAT
jgi:hypothetical protein